MLFPFEKKKKLENIGFIITCTFKKKDPILNISTTEKEGERG